MKTLLTTLLAFYVGLMAYAQQRPPRGLAIGDTVPDVAFKDVYNHTSKVVRLSDYRGQLIILDFWNTFCSNCLEAFPKVDSLQREYGDRIQFLAVSKTGYQETVDFFKKYTNVHRPAIPFITGDNVLADLFPHRGDPYHVWISPEGKVLHMASGAYLSRHHLDSALAGKSTGIPSRASYTTYLTTLLDTAYDAEIAYASYLVRQNSIKNFRIEKSRTPNEYTVSGSIQTMYQYLYQWLGNTLFSPSRAGRTRVITNRPERYSKPAGLTGEASQRWSDEHTYFYQGRVPLKDSARLFDWVRTDFDRYFGIQSAIEVLAVDCWSLVRIDSVDRIRTRGGERIHTFVSKNIKSQQLPTIRQLQNYPYTFFSSRLVSMVENLTGQPCFDETDYTGIIDITFQGETLDQPDLAQIREELQVYGLDLVLTTKDVEVLVLHER